MVELLRDQADSDHQYNSSSFDRHNTFSPSILHATWIMSLSFKGPKRTHSGDGVDLGRQTELAQRMFEASHYLKTLSGFVSHDHFL